MLVDVVVGGWVMLKMKVRVVLKEVALGLVVVDE